VDLPDPQRRLPGVSWTTPQGGADAAPGVAQTPPQGCRGRHPSERLRENQIEALYSSPAEAGPGADVVFDTRRQGWRLRTTPREVLPPAPPAP
jgi:hypothetical protein